MSTRIRTLLLLITALIAVCPHVTHGQESNTVLRMAERALGMIRTPSQVDRLIAVQYDGTGTMRVSGRTVSVPRYRAAARYDVPGFRVDFDRTDGSQVQRQIEVVAGELAWNEAGMPGGPATPVAGAVKDRLLQLWMTPHGAVKAARKAGAQAKMIVENRVTAFAFPLSPPLADTTMTVTLDAASLPVRVEVRRGANVLEAAYSDYRNWNDNGVMIPARIVQKQGGDTTWDLTITSCRCTNPYVVFPIAQNIKDAFSAAARPSR